MKKTKELKTISSIFIKRNLIHPARFQHFTLNILWGCGATPKRGIYWSNVLTECFCIPYEIETKEDTSL